ncbi:MAG: hypothetical protein COA33_012155 [Fluviicola sp.]|nr:hypothetical protein [Fluviicola sp.]
MKNILVGFLAFTIILLSFSSCKEDIELTGGFTETAVVYGLLDQSDSLHLIKITRAFIGPGDALVFATIPDSNYFTSVTGTVTEFINGTPARVFNLKDTMVLNKDPNGVFYAPEQKLYYFETNPSTPLLGNAEYRLNLSINNGAFEVNGSTMVVDGMSEDISGKNQPYRFMQSNGDYQTTLVKVQSGNSYQINTKLTIEFTEWVGTTPTVKSFKWNLGEKQTSPGGSESFSAVGQSFYELMRSNCTSDPTITKRTFNSITTTVTGGAEDLYNYILVNEPSSSLAQNKPTFTNLTASKGHPVVGIFSSRQTLTVKKYFIDPLGTQFVRVLNVLSTEELCTGLITGSYLFCSDNTADNAQSWYCI